MKCVYFVTFLVPLLLSFLTFSVLSSSHFFSTIVNKPFKVLVSSLCNFFYYYHFGIFLVPSLKEILVPSMWNYFQLLSSITVEPFYTLVLSLWYLSSSIIVEPSSTITVELFLNILVPLLQNLFSTIAMEPFWLFSSIAVEPF